MNTFLPYADFTKSAKCLDRQRLGKQRVEVLQLLKALTVPGAGWVNHPCSKMWKGYEKALVNYGQAICLEWINRGYNDTCFWKIEAYRNDAPLEMPPWLGNGDFHRSHQSNLLRKDSSWYGKFGWSVSNDLPYIWPTPNKEGE